MRAASPESIDSDLVDLLTKMFSPDLSIRPQTIDEVLSHVYFTQDKDNLSNLQYAQDGLK